MQCALPSEKQRTRRRRERGRVVAKHARCHSRLAPHNKGIFLVGQCGDIEFPLVPTFRPTIQTRFPTKIYPSIGLTRHQCRIYGSRKLHRIPRAPKCGAHQNHFLRSVNSTTPKKRETGYKSLRSLKLTEFSGKKKPPKEKPGWELGTQLIPSAGHRIHQPGKFLLS